MVEPTHGFRSTGCEGSGVALTLASPVSAIDRQLAMRRAASGRRARRRPRCSRTQGIGTVRDLLHHYPRRYIDRSQVSRIGELKIGAVRDRDRAREAGHQAADPAPAVDGHDHAVRRLGYLDLTFFNQPWTRSMYKEGYEVAVSGIAQLYRGRLQLANQEIELLKGDDQDLVHTGRITPIHRASEGITTRTIRELVWRALERLGPIPDPMPEELDPREALRAVRPCDPGHPLPRLAARARRRRSNG